MTTLLQLMINAVDELGNIARPTIVIASTDRTIQRMVVLANREGRDLAKTNWTILQKLYTFSTVASTQEYDLPSDYDRLITDTEWNRSTSAPLIGPLSPQEWQVIESGGIGSVSVGSRYRIQRSTVSGNARKFRVSPTPSSVETLAFEYISTNWCASSGGTGQSAWAADTDVNILDPDLLTLGLIIRVKRSLGLEFASEADEYSVILARAKAQDRPAPTLSLVPSGGPRLLGYDNIPATGYG